MKEQDWERKFDEIYNPDGFSTDPEVLKEFIRSLLDSQMKSEWIKEIEGMKVTTYPDTYALWNNSLEAVISKLKGKSE